jgi:hypothetical protein
MKLVLYQARKVGEVTLDPYKWEYKGNSLEAQEYLESQPTLHGGVALEGDYEDELVDGEKKLSGRAYLERLGRNLELRGVWYSEIVQD